MVPVSTLRDAVAREVVRTSLRQAAREIAVSPNGLRNFINGCAPRAETRVKLQYWVASRGTKSRPPAVGQLVRLLNELAADLTPDQVSDLARDVAGLLGAAYEARRLTPPRWVAEFATEASERRKTRVQTA